jgi:hypothetical protein
MNLAEVKAGIRGAYSSAKEITYSRKARMGRIDGIGGPLQKIGLQKEEVGDRSSREAEKPVFATYGKVRTEWFKEAPGKMWRTQNPPNRQQW